MPIGQGSYFFVLSIKSNSNIITFFFQKWTENKYQINVSSINWHRFLKFLRSSNTHLFLRTINVHLQITVNDYIGPEVEDQANRLVKTEWNQPVVVPNIFKLEKKSLGKASEKDEEPNAYMGNHMSLKSLEECIENVYNFS